MKQFNEVQVAVVNYMLASRQYPHLESYLSDQNIKLSQETTNLLKLGQGILAVDIDLVESLAHSCNLPFLVKPSLIQRRVYYYSQHLNLQFDNQEYGDYFRGLTPVLVDILRLLVEHDFMPELNQYLIPTIKDTPDGKPLYRGLQWFEKKVEKGPNIVKETFQRYYGDRFNYDHYVSSSHLLKLIDDHSKNQDLKEKANRMRQIEKYLRNIIAHEVVCVDETLVKQRVGLTPKEVHQLYHDLIRMANLKDQRQWTCLDQIDQKIKQSLKLR